MLNYKNVHRSDPTGTRRDRGLPGVRKHLSAAVPAYNLWRMVFVRRAKYRQEEDPLRRNVA